MTDPIDPIDEIVDSIRPIIDPDIGISTVDLGLIRSVTPAAEPGGNFDIAMTLTRPFGVGCSVRSIGREKRPDAPEFWIWPGAT